jgi:iron complex transport system substrate-binding protein
MMPCLFILLSGAPWTEAPSVEAQWLSEKRPASIQRIVTVAPSITELIFALGAGERVVGVSRYDDHPESVKKLQKVGGFLDPNPEAILALRPDVVIGVPNGGNRPALQRIADLGVPVLVVPGNSFADVFHAIRAVAPVLGTEASEQGKNLERDIISELLRLSKRAKRLPPAKVAIIYGWNPLVAAGPGSFADTIVAALNGTNVVTSGGSYPHWSAEQLVAAQPDVIIDASEVHGAPTGKEPWQRFSSIPAVKNKRVHAVELGGIFRPGPRIIEGMKLIDRLLHPR